MRRNLRDLIVWLLTLALDVYVVMLSGRYFGWNQTTLDAWALAGVVGMLITSRYYALRRR
jgi:hypothetical protein